MSALDLYVSGVLHCGKCGRLTRISRLREADGSRRIFCVQRGCCGGPFVVVPLGVDPRRVIQGPRRFQRSRDLVAYGAAA